MPAPYRTPGVYIEEISKFPPSVAQVETAIPAFIGYTQRTGRTGEDLTNTPTRISSLLEYEQLFGVAQPEENLSVTVAMTDGEESITTTFSGARSLHIMYYAMQAYFANGGGPCYIVSVGEYAALGTAPTLGDLQDGLMALGREDEPTLIVFPEGQALADAAEADYFTIIDDALQQCADLKDRFVIADLQATGEDISATADLDAAVTTFRDASIDNLKYGAVYFPNVDTVFDLSYEDTAVSVDNQGADTTLDAVASADGALYNRIKTAIGLVRVTLPPSPLVAGVYAHVDATRGVWKAPANVALSSVSGVTFKVTEELQQNLNVDTTAGKSINAIRVFTGRGILVWGARTLDGNSNEWRYVPVRRFFNMVEESVKKATGRFVFEPNDKNTWVKVRAMIENFLVLQWRAGALQGAKPEQAFYVKVGLGETMTALDILEGRMIVEIGMAVVRPAEFIILKFSHKMPEA